MHVKLYQWYRQCQPTSMFSMAGILPRGISRFFRPLVIRTFNKWVFCFGVLLFCLFVIRGNFAGFNSYNGFLAYSDYNETVEFPNEKSRIRGNSYRLRARATVKENDKKLILLSHIQNFFTDVRPVGNTPRVTDISARQEVPLELLTDITLKHSNSTKSLSTRVQRQTKTEDKPYLSIRQRVQLSGHSALHSVAKKSTAFRAGVSLKERQTLQDIIIKFKSLLEGSGITYFLYSGSLIGSYRHHGIVPWDDDADVIVNRTQANLLYNRLSNLHPWFFLDATQDVRWKFYSIHSRPIRQVSWAWPFLDISFFHENASHIWDVDPRFSKTFIYHKMDVFPLTRRPFMSMLLPAPRNSKVVLDKTYNIELCKSLDYSHRMEKNLRFRKVNCNLLRMRYAMVNRHRVPNGVNETLELAGKIKSWFFVPDT